MRFFPLFLICILFACSEQEETATPPNIIFLFADDQTYTAVHALGNEEIQTLNLDLLTENGTTFTHAYNMGGWNGAICIASRSMIISGRSLWKARQFQDQWRAKDSVATMQTWGKLMEQQGYNTYMTGKWHIQAPVKEVFQKVVRLRPGGMPLDAWTRRSLQAKWDSIGIDELGKGQRFVGYNRPLSETDTMWSPSDPKFEGFWEGGKHWSEVLKDDALSFIEEAKQQENPFFMYLAFNAPHDPRQAPPSFIDRYPLENISLPESWLPEYPYKDAIGCDPSLRDEALAPFPRTPYAIKKHMQEYYAIVTHLDQQIGKIIDALEASGKMDNTYIFFTADHGLSVGRHGLLGKQSLFDHSVRVPLMMVGKDIPKGKRVTEDVYLQDIMATSLELAGIEKPEYVDFHSLLDLAKGEQQESNYPSIYGAYTDRQRSIRKDGFKLIVYPAIEKMLLFDLNNDPQEMNDLASEIAYQDKVATLFKELLTLQENMEDELDLSKIYERRLEM